MNATRIRRFQADFKEALVDMVREGMARDLEALRVPKNLAFSVMTAMDELCCNVLEHSRAGWVELESTREGAELTLVLRDDGQPFDPTGGLRRDPDLENVGERKLGIYMVGRLMDRFDYRRLPEGVNETRIAVDIRPGVEP